MSASERYNADVKEPTLELDASQQEGLTNLRTRLDARAASCPASFALDTLTEHTLYRFLASNSYDVEAAENAIIAYLQWRVDEKVDSILDNPPKAIEALKKLAPYAYHGFDNDGRPVYIEKTGAIHCAKLADPSIVDPDEFIRAHVYGMEYLMNQCNEQSIKLGKRVVDLASILDMQGLGFHHRAAFGILHSSMQVDKKYYPIRIGRIYILNTPWVAPYLFQLVTPLLPEDVKSRFHVVQGNPGDFLCTVIPPENVPPEYGGKCTKCGGNCVPVFDAESVGSQDDEGLETAYVSYDLEKEVASDEPGTTFSWFFKCDEGYDIDFSVTITDQGKNGGEPFSAKPNGRCATNRGSYTSVGACKMVCKWDNNFSWMTGKNVKYMVSSIKLDSIHGAEGMSL